MQTRKNIRLKQYDYSQQNYYFVTICVNNKQKLFGKINNFQIELSIIGKTVEEYINSYNNNNIKIDYYQIMPNHLHLIFEFEKDINKTLSQVVSQFKSKITFLTKYNNLWQRGFYERVIRDQKEYEEIVKYINENPFEDKYRW